MKRFRMMPIAIQLGETASAAPEKIQVIRTGTFHHEKYGKFEVTKSHLLSFVENFKNNVRQIDLALDYAHESDKEAAAWFLSLIHI